MARTRRGQACFTDWPDQFTLRRSGRRARPGRHCYATCPLPLRIAMDLGILETGTPPGDLKNSFGSYGDMFRQLLGPDYRYTYYDVRAGKLPESIDSHDGYLITGSASGVYDGDPWIEPLKKFIQQLSGRTPLVGICFGHQIMAEAYGGRVTKSPKGWGAGLHSYEIKRRAGWMNSDRESTLSIPVSHQD